MRSFLVVLGVVGAIAALGGVYVWMQPVQRPPVVLQPKAAPAPIVLPPPPSAPTQPGTQPVIGAGQGIWMEVRDDKTGGIAWRFRVGPHQPHPDGSVDVTQPEAEFFLDDGQVLSLAAKSGTVVIPGEAARNPDLKGAAVQPSRGELKDVTLTLYTDETRESTLLQCNVDNLAFDNDTLRIATEAIRNPDGTTIPGDQVPVKVRGVEYDFDGKGLTIRWNGRDRRLQGLEIAHGQSLTWKPKPPTTQPAKPPAPVPPPVVASRPPNPPATRRSGAARPASAPATAPVNVVYRATFDRDVIVKEGDQQLASAGILKFDIVAPKPDAPASDPAKAPATHPAGGRATPAAATAPTTSPARSIRSPFGPTTSPTDKPITLTWTGKLTVVPITDGSTNLEPGQTAAELVAVDKPVEVTYLGQSFSAASLSYRGSDQGILGIVAKSSDLVPVVTMKDAKGTVINTKLLRYDHATGKVLLEGPSTAKLVLDSDKPDEPQILTAKWEDKAELKVASSGGRDFSIDRADILGQVQIQHPMLKEFTAQRVVAGFVTRPGGAKGSNFDLSDLLATGGVKARLLSKDQAEMELNAGTLEVATAMHEDRAVPRRIIARGQVQGFDGSNDIRANRVEVLLKPTTQPGDAPKVESIIAEDNVTFKARQGQSDVSGVATHLVISPQDSGDAELTMLGLPATVTSADSTLTGNTIKIDTAKQYALVSSPGTLKRNQAAGQGGVGSPAFNADLSWGSSLVMDGIANTAVLDGGVRIVGSSPDRGRVDARGDRLLVEMVDPPATRPATEPATQAASTTKPSSAAMAMLTNKQVKVITLEGNTRTNMTFADANQAGTREVLLIAPRVKVEPKGGEMIDRVVVPDAGKMLFQDSRPPTTRPTTSSTTVANLGDLSGPTAFSWSRELVIDLSTYQAQMAGDVRIVHDSTTGEPFRFQSETLVAHFAPPASPTTATTQPAQPELRRLVAGSGVQFNSSRISFSAWEMDFDPSRNLLEAIGDGAPVQVFDSTGVSTGSFQKASWNTMTQKIEVDGLLMQIRR